MARTYLRFLALLLLVVLAVSGAVGGDGGGDGTSAEATEGLSKRFRRIQRETLAYLERVDEWREEVRVRIDEVLRSLIPLHSSPLAVDTTYPDFENDELEDRMLPAELNLEDPHKPWSKREINEFCKGKSLAARSAPATLMDATVVFDERDIMQVRIAEMHPFVDFHHVVESERTHSEWRKPRWMLQYPLMTPKVMMYGTSAIGYARQLDQLGLITFTQPDKDDDPILICGAVDEIPSRDALATLKYCEVDVESNALRVPVESYMFGFGHRWVQNDTSPISPPTPIAIRASALSKISVVEYAINAKVLEGVEWGWHLSWFGSHESMIRRLKGNSHQLHNNVQNRNETLLSQAREEGVDVFQQSNFLSNPSIKAPLHVVHETPRSLPLLVSNNCHQFSHWMLPSSLRICDSMQK